MTVSQEPRPQTTETHAAAKSSAPTDFGTTEMVAALRRSFDTGRTRSLHWRLEQLRALRALCVEREDEICDALAADLRKPRFEAFGTEVGFSIGAIDHTEKRLAEWMAPTKVKAPLITQPAHTHIHHEPLGVVLIIAPWNYPFNLAVTPLVAALAAGNCAVVKPSEVSPETSAALARLLPQYLDDSCVRVLEGGVPETTAILEQRFDHILYTGNGTVGRVVMSAAAKHLTPVTLELGGKSPTLIDHDANLDVAARRIAWGKWLNCGQTCIAPDYVLVHRDVHDTFLKKLAQTLRSFYGHDPQTSDDYGRIINARHHQRLTALLDSGEVVVGGETDAGDRYIAPTVLKDVSPDSPVMQEEIFGPILPVLPVADMHEAVRFVNARPKPLALYVFTEDRNTADDVIARTSSGGAVVNHVALHYAAHDLPFGGVGESGLGSYHGKTGFDTFSHHKSVVAKPSRIDPALLYPPYSALQKAVLRRVL